MIDTTNGPYTLTLSVANPRTIHHYRRSLLRILSHIEVEEGVMEDLKWVYDLLGQLQNEATPATKPFAK